MVKKVISLLIAISFILNNTVYPLFAQGALTPMPLQLPTLRYLSINSANPYNYFNFLMDRTDGLPETRLYDETKKLVHYFFLGLTLSEDAFWVNLRPDSADKVTSDELAKTDMGKALLEMDLLLKKDVAQYFHPGNPKGKEFWEKLYTGIGKDNIKDKKVITSQRFWIVPDKADIIETEDGAFLLDAKLKVLSENEYLRLSPQNETHALAEKLSKEIITPALTNDVNSLPRYIPLRQIYHSLVLAAYYKKAYFDNKIKSSIYADLLNRNETNGLESYVPWSKQSLWQEYIQSYQKGEYKVRASIGGLARMYFTGGAVFESLFTGAGAAGIPVINVTPVYAANSAIKTVGPENNLPKTPAFLETKDPGNFDKLSVNGNGAVAESPEKSASSPMHTTSELTDALYVLKGFLGVPVYDSKLDTPHHRQISFSNHWRIELHYDSFASKMTWVTLRNMQGHDKYYIRYQGSEALGYSVGKLKEDLITAAEKELGISVSSPEQTKSASPVINSDLFNSIKEKVVLQMKKNNPEDETGKKDARHDYEHTLRVIGFTDWLCGLFKGKVPVEEDVLFYAALLHDVGKKPGLEGLAKHHLADGMAGEILRDEGLSDEFIKKVEDAIETHMGPLGTETEPGFMRKFVLNVYNSMLRNDLSEKEFKQQALAMPLPRSMEGTLLKIADMLDLMHIKGIHKVVYKRQTGTNFFKDGKPEPLADSIDSAIGSVDDAFREINILAESLKTKGIDEEITLKVIEKAERIKEDAISFIGKGDLKTKSFEEFEDAVNVYSDFAQGQADLAGSPMSFEEINKRWSALMTQGKIFNYSLKGVERKVEGKLVKMFNIGRAGKRPPTAPKANMKPPFVEDVFCYLTAEESQGKRRIQPQEIIATDDFGGVETDIIANINPFFDGHVIFTPERLQRHNQVFNKKAAIVALEALRKIGRSGYKLTFNSWLAFGSVNHLHLQAFDYATPEQAKPLLPVENELMDDIPSKSFVRDGVTVKTLPNWMVRTLVLSSNYANREALEEEILRLTAILYDLQQPFNILFTYNPQDEMYKVYVFPRKPETASKFGTGVAYLELSGEVLFVNQNFGGVVVTSKNKVDLDEQKRRLRDILNAIDSKQLYEQYETTDGENFAYYLRPSRSGKEVELQENDVKDPYMAYAPLTEQDVNNLYERRGVAEEVKEYLTKLVNPVYEKKSKEIFENAKEEDSKGEIAAVGVTQDTFDEILTDFKESAGSPTLLEKTARVVEKILEKGRAFKIMIEDDPREIFKLKESYPPDGIAIFTTSDINSPVYLLQVPKDAPPNKLVRFILKSLEDPSPDIKQKLEDELKKLEEPTPPTAAAQTKSASPVELSTFNTIMDLAERELSARIALERRPYGHRVTLDLLKEFKQTGADQIKSGLPKNEDIVFVVDLLTYCKRMGYGEKLKDYTLKDATYRELISVIEDATGTYFRSRSKKISSGVAGSSIREEEIKNLSIWLKYHSNTLPTPILIHEDTSINIKDEGQVQYFANVFRKGYYVGITTREADKRLLKKFVSAVIKSNKDFEWPLSIKPNSTTEQIELILLTAIDKRKVADSPVQSRWLLNNPLIPKTGEKIEDVLQQFLNDPLTNEIQLLVDVPNHKVRFLQITSADIPGIGRKNLYSNITHKHDENVSIIYLVDTFRGSFSITSGGREGSVIKIIAKREAASPTGTAQAGSPISLEQFVNLVFNSLAKEEGKEIYVLPNMSFILNTDFIDEHKKELAQGMKRLDEAMIKEGRPSLREGPNYITMSGVEDFHLEQRQTMILMAIGHYLGIWKVFPGKNQQVANFAYKMWGQNNFPMLDMVNLNEVEKIIRGKEVQGDSAASPMLPGELWNALQVLKNSLGDVVYDSELDMAHERSISYSSKWRIRLKYDSNVSKSTVLELSDDRGTGRFYMRYPGSLALSNKEINIRNDLIKAIEKELKISSGSPEQTQAASPMVFAELNDNSKEAVINIPDSVMNGKENIVVYELSASGGEIIFGKTPEGKFGVISAPKDRLRESPKEAGFLSWALSDDSGILGTLAEGRFSLYITYREGTPAKLIFDRPTGTEARFEVILDNIADSAGSPLEAHRAKTIDFLNSLSWEATNNEGKKVSHSLIVNDALESSRKEPIVIQSNNSFDESRNIPNLVHSIALKDNFDPDKMLQDITEQLKGHLDSKTIEVIRAFRTSLVQEAYGEVSLIPESALQPSTVVGSPDTATSSPFDKKGSEEKLTWAQIRADEYGFTTSPERWKELIDEAKEKEEKLLKEKVASLRIRSLSVKGRARIEKYYAVKLNPINETITTLQWLIHEHESTAASSPVTNAESEVDPSLRGLRQRDDNSEAGAKYGGIDLKGIQLDIERFRGLSEFKKKAVIAKIKTTLAVDALWQKNWEGLAYLYFEEVRLMLEDKIISDLSREDKNKLISVGSALQDKGLLSAETPAFQFLQLLKKP